MHTGARARKQKCISIYISIYMKTFFKTGVYIYIYILRQGMFSPGQTIKIAFPSCKMKCVCSFVISNEVRDNMSFGKNTITQTRKTHRLHLIPDSLSRVNSQLLMAANTGLSLISRDLIFTIFAISKISRHLSPAKIRDAKFSDLYKKFSVC